jgi:hypothetical protein
MIDDDVGQRLGRRYLVLGMRSHLDKFERLYYQDKENVLFGWEIGLNLSSGLLLRFVQRIKTQQDHEDYDYDITILLATLTNAANVPN